MRRDLSHLRYTNLATKGKWLCSNLNLFRQSNAVFPAFIDPCIIYPMSECHSFLPRLSYSKGAFQIIWDFTVKYSIIVIQVCHVYLLSCTIRDETIVHILAPARKYLELLQVNMLKHQQSNSLSQAICGPKPQNSPEVEFSLVRTPDLTKSSNDVKVFTNQSNFTDLFSYFWNLFQKFVYMSFNINLQ